VQKKENKLKKIILLTVAVLALFTLACLGSGGVAWTPQDPTTVLTNNGFKPDTENSYCPSTDAKCVTFSYDGSFFWYWAAVFSNGDLFFGFVVKQETGGLELRTQYGLLENVLAQVYPSNIVKDIMTSVKAFETKEGTSGNYTWNVVSRVDDDSKWTNVRVLISQK
jgi:hypothetical protein